MSSAQDTIVAAEDRPLTMRKRPDLQITESRFQGERSWMVKDPVSLKYHRLQDPEVTVLNLLDGTSSLRDIRAALQRRYPTKVTRVTDLQYLLSTFYRSGLVVVDAAGQSSQLLRRRRESDQRKWLQRCSNVLAIRLPGFDPEPLLQWLDPRFGWIFTRWGMLLWCLLAAAAGSLLALNLDEFQRRLPDFYQFFHWGNFVWLAVVMGGTKVIHEFGHGLACKHFGGECHEIGILFLVFTPAMYCDTSDSWVLPNKWHRIVIGAAGMYVEVAMASIATFVWWWTQPGLMHYLALNVMFISSVSTVVFNANPLLRYDGYYMLSDLLEIPNLAQKSRLAFLNILRVVCLGMKPVSARSLPPRGWGWFSLYTMASFVYRWIVLGFILWFLLHFFRPYGLEVIGHGFILSSLLGMIGVPIWKAAVFFAVPGRVEQVKWRRFSITAAIVASLLVAVCCVPIPSRVGSTFVIRPDGAEHLYVSYPGSLRSIHGRYGDDVSPGAAIAELANAELDLRIAELEGDLTMREGGLRDARRRAQHAEIAAQIPAAEAAVASTRRLLELLRQDAARLTLRTTRGGRLFPPSETSPSDFPAAAGLPAWHGRPLQDENLGAFLDVETLVATVGNPSQMKAVLFIDQSDIEMVKMGQPVSLMLDECPGELLRGEIREIAKIDLKIPPRELTPTAGGKLPTKAGPGGREQPMFVYYEVMVPLNQSTIPLLSGFRGEARISIGSHSIGSRFMRIVRKVIHFR